MDNLLLDYIVVALYFAVMIGAGYWGLRRARSADDYLVAGRPEERMRAWERRLD
jgi:Na+/proline symporter